MWFSPAFFEYPQEETAARLAAAAAAAAPLHDGPSGACGLGRRQRAHALHARDYHRQEHYRAPATLKADPSCSETGSSIEYLAALVPRLRAVFDGPLTYASLPFEQVDWGPFDYVGVDHYREARTEDRYVEMLQPFLATGKPVIVTEFGMRTYRGAESSGTLGFGVTDTTRLWLHTRPVIGRFFRPRLKGMFERDEAMQARELAETLDELERSGVAGALLSTFVTPEVLHRRRSSLRPRHGLHVAREVLARRAPRDRLPGHGLGAQGGVRRGGTPLRQSLIRGHASAPLWQGLVRLHGWRYIGLGRACPVQLHYSMYAGHRSLGWSRLAIPGSQVRVLRDGDGGAGYEPASRHRRPAGSGRADVPQKEAPVRPPYERLERVGREVFRFVVVTS